MFAQSNPHPAHADQLGAVHPESSDRRAAGRSQTDECSCTFVPGEVIFPALALRMEQRHAPLGGLIGRRGMICLESVARWAGETEVLENGFPVCGTGNDVLKLKDSGGQLFGSATVRAAICEMVANASLKLGGDIDAHEPAAPAA